MIFYIFPIFLISDDLPGHGPLDVAVGLFLFEVLSFVELFFAGADADFEFDAAADEVHGQGDQGGAFGGGEAGEFVDLSAVGQESAGASGGVLLFAGGVGVEADVDVEEEEFGASGGVGAVFFDDGVALGELDAAEPDGLDFGADELDAALEGFGDEVVVVGAAVGDARLEVVGLWFLAGHGG